MCRNVLLGNVVIQWHTTRMSITKIKKKQRLARICRNGNPLCTTSGSVKWCSRIESSSKSLAVPQQVKHRVIVWASNTIPRIYPREWKQVTPKLACECSQSIIHNCEKVETTQISIIRWLNKYNVVPPYNGILSSSEKEQNTYIDEPWNHYGNERSQTQKATYCMILFIKIKMFRTGKPIETE